MAQQALQVHTDWPLYRFTHIAAQFFEGVRENRSVFQAPNDEAAIRYCAILTEAVLRAVIPGEGTSMVRPRKLIAVEGERLVKNFEVEGWVGLEITCRACQARMSATREGWKCPKCGATTGWA